MRCERSGLSGLQGFVSLRFKQFSMPEGLFALSNASRAALSDAATEALSGIVLGAKPGRSPRGSDKGRDEAFSGGSCPDGARVSDGAGAATMPISSISPGSLKHSHSS